MTILISTVQGCGRAYPLENPSHDQQTSSSELTDSHSVAGNNSETNSRSQNSIIPPARALGLTVVAGNHPSSSIGTHLPNLNRSLPLEIRQIYSGNQISFVHPLPLTQTRKLYFVWPSRIYDKAILNISANHSTITPQNQRIQHAIGGTPFYDETHQRWILNLYEFFSIAHQENENFLNEVNTQTVTLHLSLADSTRIAIEVRLRVQGLGVNSQ